ncbi:ribosomal protein [Ureibacillus massiliensis 4400831 = CIP 108448 = CCUG 49529]|uniref:Ribosomal processing cysteine protease Prp n=1 Tax=Ureibacillus massiliensis 4400831 = CIP 108448 = CCUG 49529 TaxID=1211035 RepID=A0A0A3J0F9_9BACL|nr:ribosomal-processing cysteine protease Prp [Ureibacillus massiliensis]KGR90426.1 ribosomal protein [Ureibacillus massiliensis 4400831 = CIP 108448 = CCUG 49529]
MITVTIQSDENRKSYGFEISGHALSDVYGRDLVCAGASAIAFGTVNAIVQICQIEPEIEQGEQGGYLSVQLPTDLDADTDSKLQVVMNTMVTQVYTMVASYGDYIELKYKMV